MSENDITLRKFLNPRGGFIDELVMERITSGKILVNGKVERDPNRKLYHGDKVTDGDQIMILDTTPQTPPEESNPLDYS